MHMDDSWMDIGDADTGSRDLTSTISTGATSTLKQLANVLQNLNESHTNDSLSRIQCEGMTRKAKDLVELLDTAIIRTPGLSQALASTQKPTGGSPWSQNKTMHSNVKFLRKNIAVCNFLVLPLCTEVAKEGFASISPGSIAFAMTIVRWLFH